MAKHKRDHRQAAKRAFERNQPREERPAQVRSCGGCGIRKDKCICRFSKEKG